MGTGCCLCAVWQSLLGMIQHGKDRGQTLRYCLAEGSAGWKKASFLRVGLLLARWNMTLELKEENSLQEGCNGRAFHCVVGYVLYAIWCYKTSRYGMWTGLLAEVTRLGQFGLMGDGSILTILHGQSTGYINGKTNSARGRNGRRTYTQDFFCWEENGTQPEEGEFHKASWTGPSS